MQPGAVVDVETFGDDGNVPLDEAGQQHLLPLQTGLDDAFEGEISGEALFHREAPVGTETQAGRRHIILGKKLPGKQKAKGENKQFFHVALIFSVENAASEADAGGKRCQKLNYSLNNQAAG